MLGLVGVGEESGILRLLDAGTPFFFNFLASATAESQQNYDGGGCGVQL
jgi:hypothetical protein